MTSVFKGIANPTVTIGGTVSGLSGTGLVLQDNGADSLPVGANGNFTFATPVPSGGAYSTTVLTQPSNPAQNCVVTNGSGTANSDINNVLVACTSTTLPVITGLTPETTNAGSSAISLVVNGSNFSAGATVLWNGVSLTTTVVSTTQLHASIPAAVLTSAGIVNVTVANPASTGGGRPGYTTS